MKSNVNAKHFPPCATTASIEPSSVKIGGPLGTVGDIKVMKRKKKLNSAKGKQNPGITA
jgi:hypothetical protein